ncbi:MAG: ATPase [Nitrosopumilus sp. H13]|nr:MAG: ATPase [Nitrosopumilus sp. H13]
MQRIVADTSVIINGQLLSQIEAGSIRDAQIIIPQAVFDELQSQAASKKEQGFVGLEKIRRLKALAESHGLEVAMKGSHPSTEDIRLADRGRIDALITDMAKQEDATLYTSDNVQHLVAQAEGIGTVLLRSAPKESDLEFLKYFDSETMSIHLKERQRPLAKRGMPGTFTLTEVGDEPLSKEYLEMIASQIFDAVEAVDSSTIDISKTGASVIQHDDYRIAITHPPFSESYEITIVHPIVKMSLEDYDVSEKLMERFSDAAEGIVISGAPGSGKSTLASGLANFYHSKKRIVKTFESPRDLQVDPGITQYSKLEGSFDNAADILLLVRPDYTIFDEVRRREDFGTFADLRLTGVGMVGVIHASSPLDAIQRFIGKIELGIIPSVLDTVVFVKNGMIAKVYDLELKVKVPSGMTESDLARPVIEIRDFADGTLEHEIYTFGEENVIVPVSKLDKKPGLEKLAEDKIREVFKRYDPGATVEVLSDNKVRVFADEGCIASIIGRGGSNIGEIERSLGVRVDVVPRDSVGAAEVQGVQFTYSETHGMILLVVGREYASMQADVLIDGRHVASKRVGRKGQIKIPRHSGAGRSISDSDLKGEIKLVLRDS